MTRQAFSTYDELAEKRDLTKRASKSDVAHMKSSAKSRDSQFESAYEEGLKEGKHQAGSSKKGTSTKSRARSAKRTTSSGSVRKGARSAARQIKAPVVAQVNGGLRTLGLVLSVVALYVFLQSAQAVSGLLGSLSRGLDWLHDPTKSIPYAN